MLGWSWGPIEFTAAAALLIFLVYAASRLLFNTKHKKGLQQKPFLGGNDAEAPHYAAGNLYWGFTNALGRYYKAVVPLHSGSINDYIAFFMMTAAVLLILTAVLA